MSSGVMSPWAFFKTTLYKFCFGLGLATLSYYSFAEVKSWIDERKDRAEKQPGVGFQEKINALTSGGSGSDSSIKMTQFPYSYPSSIPHPSSAPQIQNPNGDVSVLSAGPEGLPSVNATPSATPDPAQASGVESAANPAGLEGEVVPNGAMDMGHPYAIPYLYDPGLGASDSIEDSDSQKKSDSSGGVSGNPTAGVGGESFQGAAAPGVFSPQTSSMGAQSVQMNSNQLLPSDLPFLTTGLRAVFTAENIPVNSSGNSFTVHTSRWSPNEGLDPEVALSIVGSNVNALTFQVGIKLQGLTGSYTTYPGSGSAVTMSARNEYRNGTLFRVFEFRLNTITVRPGDFLRQVYITLSFDAGSAANPVVGTDSTISFVRTQVQMVNDPWDFNLHAASTGTPVSADQVSYSLPIERRP